MTKTAVVLVSSIVIAWPAAASAKTFVNAPTLDAGSGALGVSALAYKPKRLNLPLRNPATAENLAYMTRIAWTSWGSSSARGSGTLHFAQFPLTSPIRYTTYRRVAIRLSNARRSGCSDRAGKGPRAFETAVATVAAFDPPVTRFDALRRC